jgi:hypothetical protein
MSKIKIATALLGGLLTSVFVGGAQAATISYSAFTDGQTNFSTQGFDISAAGGTFFTKENGGSFGVGISGAGSVVPGEIDGGLTGVPESISFVTGTQQLLNSFTVAFLYAKDNYGDSQNETASIIINGTAYTLAVTDTTHASFNFGGTQVTNNSPGVEGSGGLWTVSFLNPFLLQSIEFAPGPNGGTNAPLGDYAFNQLNTSAVPGPIVGAGLPGLMMALGGLVVLARRRRNHARDA